MTVSEPVESNAPVAAAKTLDLRGLVCPVPVVKLAAAVKTVEIDDIVEASATDPGVLADIPAWCHGTGHELVEIGRNGREFFFRVRRTK